MSTPAPPPLAAASFVGGTTRRDRRPFTSAASRSSESCGDGRSSWARNDQIATSRLRTQDRPQSAGRWLAGVNHQLSVEGSLVGGPRFAAGDISGQVWVFVQ